MKVRSKLYDTFKVRYIHKKEAVVKFDAFVAFLTIFGAIWKQFFVTFSFVTEGANQNLLAVYPKGLSFVKNNSFHGGYVVFRQPQKYQYCKFEIF